MPFVSNLPDDSSALVTEAERLISGSLMAPQIKAAFIVRIADWFGPRWLGFSGKSLGALGVKDQELTLPPFVPSRVLSESYFVREKGGAFSSAVAPFTIHVRQASSANLRRHVARLAADTAFFWLSCASASDQRAALMMYHPSLSGSPVGSYLGFRVSSGLKVVARLSFPPHERSRQPARR